MLTGTTWSAGKANASSRDHEVLGGDLGQVLLDGSAPCPALTGEVGRTDEQAPGPAPPLAAESPCTTESLSKSTETRHQRTSPESDQSAVDLLFGGRSD